MLLAESFDFRGFMLQYPYFYIFFLHPPFFLIGFYLLQRKCWKSRNSTLKAGLCFVLSILLLGASIGIGRESSIRCVIYIDVLWEKALAQYENPPQELIDHYHADGARNAFAFCGVYAMIILLLWSPLLLVFWLIDKILTRRKLKDKAPNLCQVEA